jgi:hypothetical protein
MTTTIDYLVCADDIAHFNHYHLQRSPRMRKHRVVTAVSITILWASVAFLLFTWLNVLGSLGVGMLVAGIYLATSSRRGPSRYQTEAVRKLFEEGKNRALFGRHQMLLHEDRLEVTTDYSRGEVRWEGVERVEQDEQYIYIYVSALNAYVIPKKYFPAPQHAQLFFDEAQGRHLRAMRLEGPAPRLALPAPGNLAPQGQPAASTPLARPTPGGLLPASSSGTDGTL